MTNQYPPEVIVLRDRVIAGNDKLFRAWLQIRELAHDTQEWSRQMDRWAEAQQRLHLLCSELKLRGFTDCLYLDGSGKKTKNCLHNPDNWWCCVCPSDEPYWEKELMSLPGPSMSLVKQPEFVPGQTKFLTRLGGEK